MIETTRPLAKQVVPSWLKLLANFANFIRSLQYLSYKVGEDGTVTIMHDQTGTYVRYRADGNVDVYAARNLNQRTREHILMNCSENFDRMSSVERHVHAERHT